MAKKLYEEENVREIAKTIRDLTGDSETKYKLVNMPQGMSNVFAAGHTEGYGKGLNDGAEKLKQDEARTEEDIGSTVTETSVGITVASGYYAEETVIELDVQRGDLDPIVDAAYERGYSEGLSAGGGGGNNEELEEMILNGDENYDDEGKAFYNVYKWIDVWNSNLSSAPVVISAMNRHPTLWLHAYIRTTDAQQGYYNYFTMPIPPDDGENSIEIDFPVASYILEGVRWSEDGI